MVFAYGDGQFAFSMQGCHGGTPHARLRRLLALKRRVVLVDEYLTTKRCPNCRCQTHLSKEERRDPSLYRSTFMVQPRGVAQYTRRDGAVVRKRVHGLSPRRAVLDAVESGLRGDAEHRKGLRGAMAGRSTPRVPLSPIYNVRSSVLRRLATLPRFKTRLLWTSDVVFKLFALRHSTIALII